MNHPLFEKLQALSEGKLVEDEAPAAGSATPEPPVLTRPTPLAPPPVVSRRQNEQAGRPAAADRLAGLNP
ncbi:MAG: hypothetical protein EBZ36_15190, partial [Acidobacteria bacterium]|nr:hypothetical protein [Acidobacteriota bacterium]